MRKFFLLLAPFLFIALGYTPSINITISGKITNEAGQPLASVSVTHKESNTVTVSDVQGNYSISVPEKKGLLVFVMIGYQTQQIAIGEKTNINVVLKTSGKTLEK
jgi:hypothetical protein